MFSLYSIYLQSLKNNTYKEKISIEKLYIWRLVAFALGNILQCIGRGLRTKRMGDGEAELSRFL